MVPCNFIYMSAASTLLYTCTVTRFCLCLLLQISHVPPPARSLMPEFDQYLALYLYHFLSTSKTTDPATVSDPMLWTPQHSITNSSNSSVYSKYFTCISFSSFAKLIRLVTLLEFTDVLHMSLQFFILLLASGSLVSPFRNSLFLFLHFSTQ